MIEIDNINFSYKRNPILKNLSLQIDQGECIGIVGANGCGKSTLLSILAGSRRAASASMIYNGKDIAGNAKALSHLIGYVPQENPLLPELSAYDNLFLWFHGNKKNFEQALRQESMEMLMLTDFLHKPAKSLSGGMKKRVSLGIALLNDPRLLILDEPSVALDLPCKQDMHLYLSKCLSSGKTVLITTHEEAELDLCTTLYILKNGSLHKVNKDLRGADLISQF
ncbi:MAG: ABC transporter ATP-binding protein [Lachnospiraceae bacterium]|nr:ABC transporter ATP-binding protein [Lachnospiraceae bacterium]